MKLTKIYTKTGDSGMTSLVGGIRTEKASPRLEAYGTIDELSSHIGLLIALTATAKPSGDMTASGDTSAPDDMVAPDDTPILERIQCNLFNIGTYLATDTSQTPIYPSARLASGEVELLEQQIDAILPTLPELDSFVLPGGCQAAAQCHVCRTVCRRAERCIAALAKEADIAPEYIRYTNRLSDYLFVLARKLNFIGHYSEKTWANYCK